MTEREMKIMDATMEIVGEIGLEGFSMRQLCDRAQLTPPLIYAVFPSKEELLYRCFLFVNRQIAGLFEETVLSEDMSKEAVVAYGHDAWRQYVDLMVKNGSRTLFYYAYRDSGNLHSILMRNNETVAQDMAPFMNVFRVVAEKLELFRELSPDFFYVFLLDGTGNFVRRVIQEQRAMSEQEVEMVWQLLTRGFLSYSD